MCSIYVFIKQTLLEIDLVVKNIRFPLENQFECNARWFEKLQEIEEKFAVLSHDIFAEQLQR